VAARSYSREPNFEVDISEHMATKVQASAANVSQFLRVISPEFVSPAA